MAVQPRSGPAFVYPNDPLEEDNDPEDPLARCRRGADPARAAATLPATAEGPEERRDRLHAERPIAAPTNIAMVDFEEVAAQEHAAYAAAIERAHAELAYAALIEQARAPRSGGRSGGGAGGGGSVSSRSGSCNGDVACFLECTRAIESGSSGGYSAVSSSGTYRGAYQFHQRTWVACQGQAQPIFE